MSSSSVVSSDIAQVTVSLLPSLMLPADGADGLGRCCETMRAVRGLELDVEWQVVGLDAGLTAATITSTGA